MAGSPKAEWWKAAHVGGAVSGLVGPGLPGAVIFLAAGEVSLRQVGIALAGILEFWLYGVVLFGPPAFILGCVGGILLKVLTARCSKIAVAITAAAALGLSLGGALPFAWELLRGIFIGKIKYSMDGVPLCGTTGLACALPVFWLLWRGKLLHLRSQQ